MKKTIVKLLPVALALLAMPAFADAPADVQTSQASTYTITVPAFLNIQKNSETVTANPTPGNDYASLTLDAAMGTSFRVYTNSANQSLILTATAGNVANAIDNPTIYGTAEAPKIIFGNTSNGGPSVRATEADIKKISVDNKANQSPNCFALAITAEPKVAAGVTPNPATAAPSGTLEDGAITYTMKNGVFDFDYTLGTTAIDNSFNTYDTVGTYTATLTLSQVSP